MGILRSLMNVFSAGEPRNPNGFVKKFIKDSKEERAQLEMIYKRDVILQVDSLRFVPSWFKITDKTQESYKNGYVIFFTKDVEDFRKNFAKKYAQFSEKHDLVKIEETHNDQAVVTIGKFLVSADSHLPLANEMKNFIDKFYSFKEINPSILFNIRYLSGVPG
jgi:hypothetical protein